jgi:PadR family transcriptional regulator PadR
VTRTRRPSPRTLVVLQALAEDPNCWRYGYDLCIELGIQAGSMYPILIRLADRGLLEATWEGDTVPGRPARHLYRLTGAGRAYAAGFEADKNQAQQSAGRTAASSGQRRQSRLGGASCC